MPFAKTRTRKQKVVKKRLASGEIKEYKYDRIVAPPRTIDSLAMLIQEWKNSPEWRRLSPATQDRYDRYLRPLNPFVERPAKELVRKIVVGIRNRIDGEGKPAAANAFVRAVSTLYAWGVENEYVETNPTGHIKPLPGGHFPAWTMEAVTRALDVMPEHLRRLILLALYTGQRRGDLCALAWSNYDGTSIRVIQGKTRVSLVIPVHPVLKAAMDGWERRATTILVNHRGRPWKPGSASHGMKLAVDRLGFPETWNIHGFRKLAASNLAEAGCSAHEIAAITGHKTLAMVSFYTRGADQGRMAGAAIHRLQFGSKKP